MVRLAILDVGSNTIHLLVVDAAPNARPVPAADHRWDSPLLRHRQRDGRISPKGLERLVTAVREAHGLATALGVGDFSAFATSAMRDLRGVEALVTAVRSVTGVDLHILEGDDEARLTFLAARRWFGWGSGRLLVTDIGGGSLELAIGTDEIPDTVASLPLGAARLTRDHLRQDPPGRKELTELRRHVDAQIAARVADFAGAVDHVAGTSKTLRSLARVAGAAASSEGLYVSRTLSRDDAEVVADKLACLSARDRGRLPGVSATRAPQLAAGAVVAAALMRILDIDAVEICPWALREGVILMRHDWISAG